MNRLIVVGAIALLMHGLLSAQKSDSQATVPIYNVTVVERGVDAVNYRYRSGPTKIDFRGTVLLPDAKGEATVQSRRGRTEIEARFENLQAPARFGPQFLTYVLWALSPEGSVHNLGEIVPDSDNRAKVRATTDLETFGMIITAEPYASVAIPSEVVTLKNQVRADTVGKVEPIQPKFELMPRSHYTWQVVDSPPTAQTKGPKVSMDRYEAILELYQAQNAVAIARAAGADKYASSALARAQANLNEAQQLLSKKGRTKLVVQSSREATQAAEDARVISERSKQAEQLSEARRKRGTVENAAAASPSAAGTPPVVVSAVGEPAIVAPGSADTTGTLPRRLLDQVSRVLPVQDTARGLVTVLPPQSFDGVALRPAATKQLASVAAAVSSEPRLTVQVEGHSGPGESEAMSRERAQNVRDALIASGLGPTQVAVREGSAVDASGPGVELIISGQSNVLGASAQ